MPKQIIGKLKSQFTSKNAFFTALFVMIGIAAFGQGIGKISGVVADKKTGETLIGVSVRIAGTTKGVATDVDGKYIFPGLEAGKYIIEVSYVGYSTKKITDVEVKGNSTTTLDVVMEEATGNTLSQVVITGSYKQESNNSLYAQQKNSPTISDGISSESIKRSPDKNTSEVLKRVSGTTIQEGKFVVIRGLSDRYNNASLDHGTLPSTEPNRKAFSFDIVPSNLVDNIIINKTATPDLPADFAGGAVQILTKDIPSQNFISIAAGFGYNTASTFKNFESGPRNISDYFGFDNGDRKLSSSFPSTSKISNGLTNVQNIAAIKSLPQDFRTSYWTALPSQNYQFSVGRVKQFDDNKKKIGVIVSITYRNTQNTSADLKRDFHVYDYVDNQFKFSTNIGALANFAYNFGNSKITLKNIYNKIFDDSYLRRTGTDLSRSSDNKFYAFDLTEKSLLKSTLEGDHKLGENNAKLNWSIAFSNVQNVQPDQRKVGYSRNIADRDNPNVKFSANVTSLGKENTRLFSDLNENSYAGNLNYILPLNLFKKSATFKAGLSSQFRERTFDVRFLGLELDLLSVPDAQAIRERPLSRLYGKDLIEANAYKLKEIPNAADRYTANSLTNAAYIMLDNKIAEKLRVVWGVRAEQFNLNLDTYDSMIAPIEQDNVDLLPSANFTYSVNTKFNIRASYYRTLARPEFRELAPFQYYDYELLATQQGNPDLKRALIDNADLRFEFYPAAGQILSISGFYKKFNNAIESAIDDVNSTTNITYFNSEKANVYGFELEARKTLGFVSDKDFFKNTTVYANLSLIKSEVQNPNNPLLIDKKRPMVGQAPYVINAGIQHSFMESKYTVNVLYNRVGRRIYKAGGQNFPSVWEAPRNVLDAQFGWKILKNKAELKFNAGDILNQSSVLYFDRDLNKTYNLNSPDETISAYKPGGNYSISFSYTF